MYKCFDLVKKMCSLFEPYLMSIKLKWPSKTWCDIAYKEGKRVNAYYTSVASPFDTNDGHGMN